MSSITLHARRLFWRDLLNKCILEVSTLLLLCMGVCAYIRFLHVCCAEPLSTVQEEASSLRSLSTFKDQFVPAPPVASAVVQ